MSFRMSKVYNERMEERKEGEKGRNEGEKEKRDWTILIPHR